METVRALAGRVVRPRAGRPWRRAARRWRREAAAAIGFTFVLLLPIAFSAFSASTGNAANTVAAGTVTLTDNDSNDTVKMFDLTLLKPGDTATSCIDVTYTGSLPATVKLFATDPGTGLGDYVDVTITRGTISSATVPSCTGFTADTTNYGSGAGIIYTGELDAIPTTGPTGLADPHTASLAETWTTNEEHAYKIQVTVQDQNGGQGLTAEPAFTWQASNTTGYSSVVLSDNPVNYWKLDEANGSATAVDAVGANNLTYNGSPLLGTTSGVKDANTAATFDQADDHIEGSDFDDFTGNATMSAELWVKPIAASALYPVLLGKHSTSLGGWNLYLESTASGTPNSVTVLRTDAALANTNTVSNYALTTTAWHHVVVTYDGNRVRTYVDGSLKVNAVAATVLPNTATNFVIGSKNTHTQRYGGLMDEVAIYNYALSQQQITEHYNAGKR